MVFPLKPPVIGDFITRGYFRLALCCKAFVCPFFFVVSLLCVANHSPGKEVKHIVRFVLGMPLELARFKIAPKWLIVGDGSKTHLFCKPMAGHRNGKAYHLYTP